MDITHLTEDAVVTVVDREGHTVTARVKGFWDATGRETPARHGWPIVQALDKFGRQLSGKWVTDPTSIIAVVDDPVFVKLPLRRT